MKLYISPCPNDTFMFDAIVNRRIDLEGFNFEVEYHDIEQLNERAIQGEAEISKISCAILPLISENYRLSDSGAALGRGNGPLLVRRAGELSPLHRIAVPGLHTTATALIRRLHPEIEELRPMLFSTIAEAVERGEVDGGVLIHEGRFLYQDRGLELIADLGLEWEERTSLPLPLGGIALRCDMGSDKIHLFERLLRRSIEYAFQNPLISRDYILSHAQEMEPSVIEAHIKLFVNEYSLSLGTDGRAAIGELTAE